jgi:hypothetical protein
MRPFHFASTVHAWLRRGPSMGSCCVALEGRSVETWIEFDLYGHQIVAHQDPNKTMAEVHNPVDGHDVPVPHFGLLEMGPCGIGTLCR